jgi:predicted nucleic acid-binding protein
MEWLTRLQGQIVGLDTAPLIYFIEENSTYLERVCAFFTAMEQGEFQVVSSTLILTEVLVHPLRASNTALAQDYRAILFNQENLTIVSVSPAIAERAAYLRANYNLRTPDAIQIATALQENAAFFITNDTRLPAISGLEILVLDKL